MQTIDFFKKYPNTNLVSQKLADVSDDMAILWDALLEQKEYFALLRIAEQDGVFDDMTMRKIACRIVRELPVRVNLTAWDLVPDDERHYWQGHEAIQIVETYISGKATLEDLEEGYELAAWASQQACTDLSRGINEMIKYTCASDEVEISEVLRAYVELSNVEDSYERMFSIIAAYGNPFRK